MKIPTRLAMPLVLIILLMAVRLPGQNRVDALYKAIDDHNLKAVKQSIAQGLSPNVPASDGSTPLMMAASQGHCDIVNFLLTQGAQATATDAQGKSVLMAAAEAGQVSIVEILLSKKVPVNISDKAGNTALMLACAWKENLYGDPTDDHHGKVVALLLNAGSLVNPANMQGQTPLMLAAKSGSVSCLKALLEQHAKVQPRDTAGRTALLYAADYGYADAVDLLVRHHADVNAASNAGDTPLMLVAENGDARSVRLLLIQGAMVHQKDTQGRTAYDRAILVNVGPLLTNAGAKPSDKSRPNVRPVAGGVTPVDLALYDLMIADLRKDRGFHPWKWSQEKGGQGPLVLNETEKFADYELENLKWEVERDSKSGHKADPDNLSDVKRRNKKTVSLRDYRPMFEARAASRKEIDRLYNREKPTKDRPFGFPSFKCILRFAMPGFMADGNTALVFFWFSDGGMHGGGRGVYCLKKQDGVWQVAWKEIGFYL